MIITTCGAYALRAGLTNMSEALATARFVRSAGVPGVVDIVTAGNSVVITYNDVATEAPIRMLLAECVTTLPSFGTNQLGAEDLPMPVRYDGPDVDRFARALRLSPHDAIAWHHRTQWTATEIGERVGHWYLDRTDAAPYAPYVHAADRHVPRGAVLFGAGRTGIHQFGGPTRWLHIGTITHNLPAHLADPVHRLSVGTNIQFVPWPAPTATPASAEATIEKYPPLHVPPATNPPKPSLIATVPATTLTPHTTRTGSASFQAATDQRTNSPDHTTGHNGAPVPYPTAAANTTEQSQTSATTNNQVADTSTTPPTTTSITPPTSIGFALASPQVAGSAMTPPSEPTPPSPQGMHTPEHPDTASPSGPHTAQTRPSTDWAPPSGHAPPPPIAVPGRPATTTGSPKSEYQDQAPTFAANTTTPTTPHQPPPQPPSPDACNAADSGPWIAAATPVTPPENGRRHPCTVDQEDPTPGNTPTDTPADDAQPQGAASSPDAFHGLPHRPVRVSRPARIARPAALGRPSLAPQQPRPRSTRRPQLPPLPPATPAA